MVKYALKKGALAERINFVSVSILVVKYALKKGALAERINFVSVLFSPLLCI